VYHAQGNLEVTAKVSKSSIRRSYFMKPYVLSNARPRPGAKNEVMLVHGGSISSQPSLRLEVTSIQAIDVLIASNDSGFHADTVTGRSMRACYFKSADWCDSRHG
jgi:hypothetical protein